MFSKKLAAAAAVVAATAVAAPAAQAGERPLPPGDCVTHGAAGLAYDVGVNCRTVEHDGIDRRYIVYVPHHPTPAAGAPVVLMFHGSSGTGEQFLKISGWREQAERTGLVAVFPTGLRYRVTESGRRSTKWNEFGLAGKVDLDERPRGYPEDSPMPADDVGFVDAIMADVGAQLPIDRHRVYASGFSNGASFTARLSLERSNRIAAAGYSAGGLLEAQDAPDRAVPTYVSLGTRDDRVLDGTGLTELPLNPVEILTVTRRHAAHPREPHDVRPRREPVRHDRSPALDDAALARHRKRSRRRGVPVRDARRRPAQVPQRPQQPGGLQSGPRVLGLLREPPAAVGVIWLTGRENEVDNAEIARPSATGARLRRALWPIGLFASFLSFVPVLSGDASGAAVIVFRLTALSFIVSGLIAWQRRPDNRVGALMVATGFGVLVNPLLSQVEWSPVQTLGVLAQDWWTIVFVVLLLVFPHGRRLHGRLEWLVVAFAIPVALLQPVWLMFADEEGLVNDLLVSPNAGVADVIDKAQRATLLAATFSLFVILALRWWRASPPMRRVLLPTLAGGATMLSFAGMLTADLIAGGRSETILLITLCVFATVPLAFLAGLLRSRLARVAVGGLLVELRDTTSPTALRDALAIDARRSVADAPVLAPGVQRVGRRRRPARRAASERRRPRDEARRARR